MPVGFTSEQREPDHGKWMERRKKMTWDSRHCFLHSIKRLCAAGMDISWRLKVDSPGKRLWCITHTGFDISECVKPREGRMEVIIGQEFDCR